MSQGFRSQIFDPPKIPTLVNPNRRSVIIEVWQLRGTITAQGSSQCSVHTGLTKWSRVGSSWNARIREYCVWVAPHGGTPHRVDNNRLYINNVIIFWEFHRFPLLAWTPRWGYPYVHRPGHNTPRIRALQERPCYRFQQKWFSSHGDILIWREQAKSWNSWFFGKTRVNPRRPNFKDFK